MIILMMPLVCVTVILTNYKKKRSQNICNCFDKVKKTCSIIIIIMIDSSYIPNRLLIFLSFFLSWFFYLLTWLLFFFFFFIRSFVNLCQYNLFFRFLTKMCVFRSRWFKMNVNISFSFFFFEKKVLRTTATITNK